MLMKLTPGYLGYDGLVSRPKPILDTALAASKINEHFENGQK
jgi:hypothetical protein